MLWSQFFAVIGDASASVVDPSSTAAAPAAAAAEAEPCHSCCCCLFLLLPLLLLLLGSYRGCEAAMSSFTEVARLISIITTAVLIVPCTVRVIPGSIAYILRHPSRLDAASVRVHLAAPAAAATPCHHTPLLGPAAVFLQFSPPLAVSSSISSCSSSSSRHVGARTNP